MNKIRFFLASILGAMLISSCAPQLMSVDRFPIPLGQSWTVEIAGSKPLTRTFVLRGAPTQKEKFVSYAGRSEGDKTFAWGYDDGLFGIEIYLEDDHFSDGKDVTNSAICWGYPDEGERFYGKGTVGPYDIVNDSDVETWASCQIYRTPAE